MSENYFVKLIKQLSMYFSSGFIIVFAGVITYPIWTRVFTKAEYGQMSLANATLAILVIFSKFGIQHAALRFYSEFKEHKRNLDITYYYTTACIGVFIISSIIATGFFVIVEFFYSNKLDVQYIKILHTLPLLIIFGALNNIFLMFMRAEQNVRLYSILTVVSRYLTILANLGFVLVFKLGLIGFFWGCVLIDGIFSLFLLIKFVLQKKIRLKAVSFPLFKESISYGLPILGFEISYLLLTIGDRFFIEYFLGAAAVGIYSASYNLTTYIVEIFASPFQLAVIPLFISIWEKEGKEQTQQLLSSVSRFYFMIGIPIIFAVSFIGRDLLVLLASPKFEEGYVIMPFVIIGYVLNKANFLYGAGLYLKKKTMVLLVISFCAAALNIVLNIGMIPYLGLYGAAIATLVSYLFQVILLITVSSRTISFKLPIFTLVKSVVISIVMVIVMLSIQNMGSALIFVRAIVGFLIYSSGIFIFDARMRTDAGTLLHEIFVRRPI